MAKSIISRLRLAAGKRAKRLQAAAEKAADEVLQQTYTGTAGQALRGAGAVSTIVHENEKDIAKAKRSIAPAPAAKKVAGKRNRSKRTSSRSGKRKGKRT